MPAYPSSTTVYSSASQTVITYQDSVRRVVRVGKVRLDLAPKSPSYYRLASLNPGEGTLGHLLPGEDGMSFGKFRDTIVRVTGDEFVDAAKPDQAVLLVHSIVPDTGL
jgi:hypothetical protein